jgi:hypothetical protein
MNYQSNNKNNNNALKPFCKVCFDAGKTDTAHFVRKNPDPKSPVVCPTLLALQCRYCDHAGHTVKYCAILKKNNKDKARVENHIKRVAFKPPVVEYKPKNNNLFALLDDSDEDNNEDNNETHVGNPPYDNDDNDDNNNDTNTNRTWAQIASNHAYTLPPGVYSANLLIADDEW